MPKNKVKPVGVFEADGVAVLIYPKDKESQDEAIARVSSDHNVPVSDVKKCTSSKECNEKIEEEIEK
jgi:hypothetical protein